jgi:hypothetical protein
VGASPWGAVVPFVVNMYEPESIKRVGSVADAYVGLSEQGWVVRNLEGMLLRSNEGGC